MNLTDIHTHHAAPQPAGVVSLRFAGEPFELLEGQAYSVGIHPWDSALELTDDDWKRFRQLAQRPEIVAIGECGVDLSGKGAPLFRQLNLFRLQVELSESLGKPLVIHDVKAHDIIVGLRRDLKPVQNWVIHGFRGKPQVAEMLIRSGCYVSFGALFNDKTPGAVPEDRILAETDESPLDIGEVISKLSEAIGRDMSGVISANTKTFLQKRQ